MTKTIIKVHVISAETFNEVNVTYAGEFIGASNIRRRTEKRYTIGTMPQTVKKFIITAKNCEVTEGELITSKVYTND